MGECFHPAFLETAVDEDRSERLVLDVESQYSFAHKRHVAEGSAEIGPVYLIMHL